MQPEDDDRDERAHESARREIPREQRRHIGTEKLGVEKKSERLTPDNHKEIEEEIERSSEDRKRAREGDRIQDCPFPFVRAPRGRAAIEVCTPRLSPAPTRGLSSLLQKPVDDGPRVRFLCGPGRSGLRSGLRRPRRLRLRPVLRSRFRRARWRGCVRGRPASFGSLQRRGCLSEAAS
jgi:hypothetical protein